MLKQQIYLGWKEERKEGNVLFNDANSYGYMTSDVGLESKLKASRFNRIKPSSNDDQAGRKCLFNDVRNTFSMTNRNIDTIAFPIYSCSFVNTQNKC